MGFSELSLENALKRILLIAISMQKDALLAAGTMDTESAKNVVQRLVEVERFGLSIARQLNNPLSETFSNHYVPEQSYILGCIVISRTLQRIANNACAMAEQAF
jgi:phosphate uptake regulator